MKQSKEFYQAQLQMLNAMSQEAFNEMYTAGYEAELGEAPDAGYLARAKRDVYYCAVNAQVEFMEALLAPNCKYAHNSLYEMAIACGLFGNDGVLHYYY